MIRVAVSGANGRMGSLVARNVMREDDMELVVAFDVVGIGTEIRVDEKSVKITDASDMDSEMKKARPDVLVDFTYAEAAVKNVKIAARNKVKPVVGTTGFTEEQMDEMRKEIKKAGVPAVISPNFSIGVNVFFSLLSEASRYLKEYDVEIIEAHRAEKRDAPSGTALKAAEIIASRKGIDVSRIAIHSIRAGDIVGDHIVMFVGNNERLELTHRANSREVFARGAIKAVRWVHSKEEGGIYSMKDVLGFV